MLKVGGKVAGILFLVSILLMNSFPVLGDDPPGSIHGIVFVDEDGDGQYDPGEPVLEGVTIGLTDGEIILEAKTDGNGAFTFSVGPGAWQGVIYPPLGYTVVNDATREVVIELGGSLEAVLDFGLVAETTADQAGVDSAEHPEGIGVEEESVEVMPEETTQTEYYDGDPSVPAAAPDDGPSQDNPLADSQMDIPGTILPESGFPIPLRWGLVILVAAILLGGACLIFLGRRLLR